MVLYYFADSAPIAIDIDPVNNLLYLADNGKDAIQVIDFEAKQITTIISNNVPVPYGILVDSLNKWVLRFINMPFIKTKEALFIPLHNNNLLYHTM